MDGATYRLGLEEYLAIPYVLTAYSAIGDDGRWHRYVEYDELGCTVEGDQVPEAVERLEQMRVARIRERFARGEDLPVPRAPLSWRERAVSTRDDAGQQDAGRRDGGEHGGGAAR